MVTMVLFRYILYLLDVGCSVGCYRKRKKMTIVCRMFNTSNLRGNSLSNCHGIMEWNLGCFLPCSSLRVAWGGWGRTDIMLLMNPHPAGVCCGEASPYPGRASQSPGPCWLHLHLGLPRVRPSAAGPPPRGPGAAQGPGRGDGPARAAPAHGLWKKRPRIWAGLYWPAHNQVSLLNL